MADAYQALIDARDHAIAMRGVTSGTMPTIPDGAMDDYLAAPTPLAFWRKHRGFTHAVLAKNLDVLQVYLSSQPALAARHYG